MEAADDRAESDGQNATGISTSPSSQPTSYGLRQRGNNTAPQSAGKKEGTKRKEDATPLPQQGSQAPKRTKTPVMTTSGRPRIDQDELEGLVGVAVGLDDMQPEEEEMAMLPARVDVDAYIKVRAHGLKGSKACHACLHAAVATTPVP